MNKIEIRDFRKFLNERNILLMFSTNYRQNHLTVNPPTLDEYLDGKDFWLSIHDEWIKMIQQSRAEKAESDQLESLGLEIIDIKTKSSNFGLPKNTCSLSLKGGNRFSLNVETSKKIAKKLSTHMLLTRSRKTMDVVLMFNRQKGIEVKFRSGYNSLQFNNAELVNNLIDLLGLDSAQEYYLLDIQMLTETKDYLLFRLKKKE